MDKRPRSGRPRTAMMEENEAMIEDLICLQEEKPGSHMSLTAIHLTIIFGIKSN